MHRPIKYLCLTIALGATLLAGSGAVAADTGNPADSAQTKAKLAQVRARIAALTQRREADLKRRDAEGARLRQADLDITAKRARVDALRAALATAQRRHDDLFADVGRRRRALDAQRAVLADQVRAAYLLGPQERLKLLLNQDDPAAVGRLATYYGYFVQARARLIADMDERASQLEETLRQADASAAELRGLEADATRDMRELQGARAERVSALEAVNRQVMTTGEQIASLQREERAEEDLLDELARALKDVPLDPQQNFADLRGKLPWPVTGRLAAHFQDRRSKSASGPRWNGILIDAPRGAKVRASYFGRVLYADWLPGLGLLLIVGHNGNYMTLYGHAEVLYKAVGDRVAPGDVIAALADSAGADPQLYFEIRAGRTPQDPALWLKSKP